MQQPTCSNMRIRSTADAHKIFMGVRQGFLHMVSRRLDADERLALRSGCIYAWEERGPHTETTGLGIERFTEGRRWSPSRVRDEFLFYYEKYSPPPDLNPGGKLVEVKPPRDWDPLVKQTHSVWVETERGRRKWHLTAYFTQATIDQLSTVDNISRIRELVIPEGMFKSTRLAKNRARADENKSSDVSKTVTSRSYAAYSTPYQYRTQTPTRGTPRMYPMFMSEPYHTRRSSPVYETSHSSVPPQDGGHHHQVAYPNENGSQFFPPNSYHRSSNSFTSFLHSTSNGMPSSAGQEGANSYYRSPSPWSNENALDYSNSPPLPLPPSPLTPPIPSTYNQAESSSFGYTYQGHPSMQNNSTPLYSTQYSLNSGYSSLPPPPPLSLPNPTEGGGHNLSPLSIPERSNSVHYSQEPSPISPEALPTLQNGTESYVRAALPELAPLDVIQRAPHRRELQDELTLWRLRASQANP